jgi:hypothetical protein
MNDKSPDPPEQQARIERRRAEARQWRLQNPDRVRTSRDAWRAANPERYRELNRLSMRRQAERKKTLAAARAKARDRSRARRESDPEGTRSYKRRWNAAHPDKVREYNRRYAEAHRAQLRERGIQRRDRNPDAAKARVQRWASQHPQYAADYQRAYRQDPENYAKALQANRDARRLARKLRAAALPPKQIRRTTAGERRANDRDADRFFTSPLVRVHYKQYDAFEFALDNHVRTHAADLRARAQRHIDGRVRAGLPTQTLQNAMLVQAVWDVVATGMPTDTLTAADVARATTYVREAHAQRVREQRFAKVVSAVQNYANRNAASLRDEADLENRARAIAGKPTLRVDILAHHIAFERIQERLDLRGLSGQDISKALNLARESHPVLFDAADTGPVTSPASKTSTPSRK